LDAVAKKMISVPAPHPQDSLASLMSSSSTSNTGGSSSSAAGIRSSGGGTFSGAGTALHGT